MKLDYNPINLNCLSKPSDQTSGVEDNYYGYKIIISDNMEEIIILLIKVDHKTVIISSIYIPNKAPLEVYSKYFYVMNNIYHNYPNSAILCPTRVQLGGDQNLL